jgi:hypothetical protein
MDNSLPLIRNGKVLEPKVYHVLFQLHHLRPTGCFFDKRLDINEAGSIRRGHIVIDGCEGAVGASNAATGEAEAFKGLWRCHFVNQVAIDVNERRHAVIVDNVVIPDLIVQRARFGRGQTGSTKGAATGGRDEARSSGDKGCPYEGARKPHGGGV